MQNVRFGMAESALRREPKHGAIVAVGPALPLRRQ